jgi:nitroreductase
MNTTIELLITRRSAPPVLLAAPGPSPQELDTLLEIATRVPDHGKLAPWRFIIFEGEGRDRAGKLIADIYTRANPGADATRVAAECKRLSLAPFVIAVVSTAAPHVKIPEWEQVLSAGAVCMNLVIAANAMGFATAWLTEWYAYDRGFLTALGLGESEKIAGFIHIGRAPEPREDRVRPDVSQLVARF